MVVTFVDATGWTVDVSPNEQPSSFATHPWLRYNGEWLETQNINDFVVVSLNIDQASL